MGSRSGPRTGRTQRRQHLANWSGEIHTFQNCYLKSALFPLTEPAHFYEEGRRHLADVEEDAEGSMYVVARKVMRPTWIKFFLQLLHADPSSSSCSSSPVGPCAWLRALPVYPDSRKWVAEGEQHHPHGHGSQEPPARDKFGSHDTSASA